MENYGFCVHSLIFNSSPTADLVDWNSGVSVRLSVHASTFLDLSPPPFWCGAQN